MTKHFPSVFEHSPIRPSFLFSVSYLVFHILTTLIITGVTLYENNNR